MLSPMSASQAMAVFVALVSAAVKAEPLPELCSFTNVGWCTSATTSRLSKWEEAHVNCNWIHGDDQHETGCCTGGLQCECAHADFKYQDFNYDCCDLDGYCGCSAPPMPPAAAGHTDIAHAPSSRIAACA